ncbi:MAG: hypothetical protein RQ741_09220 [Wenzhouxiangellaceae bacterium]|nr:hypothetical protein [Wenzhouxiangellaceae bacterium]
MKFTFVIRTPRALLPACLSLLVLLAGCGFMRPDRPVYVASEEVQPVAVPEDLTQPEVRPVFEIPGYSLPELAAQGDESLPPAVPTSAEAEQARSRIRFGPTGLYLEVDDEAASVWRRLGFALDRGEMSLEQVLPEQRRFVVRFDHQPIPISERGLITKMVLFWKAQPMIDYSGTYVLEIQRATGVSTRVAILDADGQVLPMQDAEFVLNRLQDRLG